MVITVGASAASPTTTRFHNEASDTTQITEMLIEGMKAKVGADWFAERLIGRPYAVWTMEQSPEMLTVNMDEFDCTTMTETAIAMTITINEGRSSWRDFIYNLEQIRYRSGEVNGYGSRLHYVSDWVIDNTHRGNFREVTDRVGTASYVIKTLDYMSANRDKYPALEDSANYSAIKNIEMGYRSLRFPIIKSLNIEKAQLRDGDIIAIASGNKNLDVSHMGVVKIIDGQPHLIHASSKAGKVIIDPTPLSTYVKRYRGASGIRVFRID